MDKLTIRELQDKSEICKGDPLYHSIHLAAEAELKRRLGATPLKKHAKLILQWAGKLIMRDWEYDGEDFSFYIVMPKADYFVSGNSRYMQCQLTTKDGCSDLTDGPLKKETWMDILTDILQTIQEEESCT